MVDYNDLGFPKDWSFLTGPLYQSQRDIAQFGDAFQKLNEEREKLEEMDDELLKKHEEEKRARRENRKQKVKKFFSSFGKGFVKVAKLLSLGLFTAVEAVGKVAKLTGKVIAEIGRGIVKVGGNIKQAVGNKLGELDGALTYRPPEKDNSFEEPELEEPEL